MFVPITSSGLGVGLGHWLCVQNLKDRSCDGAFVVDGLDGIGCAGVVCHGGGEYVRKAALWEEDWRSREKRGE